MARTLYVSTAIPYVNAPPHLGFALEMVLADALARHGRLRGERVHFATGTDDNSLSNVRAAEAVGVPTREFVDANAARYQALKPLLAASFDDFVRTSTDPRHRAAVDAIWQACARAGDLERRRYGGLYCVGCEQFYDPDELSDGLCPEHRKPPEAVEEENWFFRLSRYEGAIRDALASGRLRIEPRERAREVDRLLAGGLRDISVSRSRSRARGWGIPVPGDPDQVVWVWLDALANYLATLGYPSDQARWRASWADADRRVHVVGKGIVRFHAVVWPALLVAAGLPLPTTIWAHGYVTIGGEKIGKSRGNAVDPARVRRALRRRCAPVLSAPPCRAEAGCRHRRRAHSGRVPVGAGRRARKPPRPYDRTPAKRRRSECPCTAGDRGRPLGRSSRGEGGRPGPGGRRSHRTLRAGRRAARRLERRGGRQQAPRGHRPLGALEGSGCHPAGVHAILHHTVAALSAIGRELLPFLPDTAEAILRALATPTDRGPILFPKERPPPDRARPESPAKPA